MQKISRRHVQVQRQKDLKVIVQSVNDSSVLIDGVFGLLINIILQLFGISFFFKESVITSESIALFVQTER